MEQPHPPRGRPLAIALPARRLPGQLPFAICRQLGLTAVCERSFKLEVGGGLVADRYVLGVPAAQISADALEAIVGQLGMPANPQAGLEQLQRDRLRASTVYLGYEQGPADGGSLRLYFEFWDEVVRRLHALPAAEIAAWSSVEPPLWEMGVGYKWRLAARGSAGAGSLFRTDYGVRPLLSHGRALHHLQAQLQACGMPAELQGLIGDLLAAILGRSPEIDPVLLVARENDSQRDSFDLCLHRYQLRLKQLDRWLTPIVQCILGPQRTLADCVREGSPDAWITHLSAGRTRQGLPYVAVYYDPEGGAA